MTSLHLDQFLSGHVFGFIFIFSRLIAVFLLFPGLGEAYVPARTRLMLAMLVSFLLMGPLLPIIPPPPAGVAEVARLIVTEFIIGLFFGTLLRLIMSSLETAGTIIAMQTGLSNATILNPALATQSPLSSAFLSIIGATLVFVTGLDHMLLRALVETYQIFPPGAALETGDMAQSFIQAVNRSFIVGVELAAPFMVIGLLMFIALGLLQRLLPMVQLFLVVLPVQIWGGLFLFATTIAGIMTVWLTYFDDTVGSFVNL